MCRAQTASAQPVRQVVCWRRGRWRHRELSSAGAGRPGNDWIYLSLLSAVQCRCRSPPAAPAEPARGCASSPSASRFASIWAGAVAPNRTVATRGRLSANASASAALVQPIRSCQLPELARSLARRGADPHRRCARTSGPRRRRARTCRSARRRRAMRRRRSQLRSARAHPPSRQLRPSRGGSGCRGAAPHKAARDRSARLRRSPRASALARPVDDTPVLRTPGLQHAGDLTDRRGRLERRREGSMRRSARADRSPSARASRRSPRSRLLRPELPPELVRDHRLVARPAGTRGTARQRGPPSSRSRSARVPVSSL